jgi:hypothetical protein
MHLYIKQMSLHIIEARSKLEELNNLLQEKCKDLSLTLDYYNDMEKYGITDISAFNNKEDKDKEEDEDKYNNYLKDQNSAILCLNYKNSCISSLILGMNTEMGDDDEIEIASKTNSNYEGRKFNKLLRAVIIIIGGSIKSPSGTPIKFIFSRAENPVSAFLMINTFKDNFPISAKGKFLSNEIKEDGKVTFSKIKEYMDEKEGNYIKTRVRTTPEKIKLAKDVFDDVLNSFQSIDKQCIRGGKKTKKMKKSRKLKKSRKYRK